MDVPETPPPADLPPAGKPETGKVNLPDPKNAFAVPDKFRLPFHGKMVTPTVVPPSAADRLHELQRQQKRRRRRGFLLGLLVGQLLIIALDLGGEFFLRTHPHFKLQAPIRVASIVFLGMAAGSAVMVLAVALIYVILAMKSLFGRKSAAVGRGIWKVILTVLALGVSMGVILGTAWFMIPAAEWKPTRDFARDKGVEVLEASKSKVRSIFTRGPAK
jgi:hypothetical protein